MKNTGFSEITIERLEYSGTEPWFIELALTGDCNFNCKYCNRFKGSTSIEQLTKFFSTFTRCKHIQITGGEPTIHPQFKELFTLCRNKADKIGLSTNGTYGIDRYKMLDVDLYSISLDDISNEILKKRGYLNPGIIKDTIRELSKFAYVNVGTIIDSINIDRINEIIKYILALGVNDIKLSTSTHGSGIPKIYGDFSKYPILDYRVKRFNEGSDMRGCNSKKCGIALSDISVVGENHYPCLVYFREKGLPIGKIHENWQAQRQEWVKNHNPQQDPICKKFCMDFKSEFNCALENK